MAAGKNKTLIYQWDFADTTKTEEERLTDLVNGVVARLGYNASLHPDGLILPYGDSNYMKAYAFMKGVAGRNTIVEIDVASFSGNWDSGQHGRFVMMDDSTSSFDEGLVFNATMKQWAFYDSTNGWSEGFTAIEKNAFSGKTVGIEVGEDGTTRLFINNELVGTSNTKMPEKNTNLIIGSSAKAATGAIVSEIRVYSIETEKYYTVRFLNKDGTNVISQQVVQKGEDAEAPVPPKYEGFIFIGWSASFKNVQSDITIYPRYREIPPHPRLNFYSVAEDGSSGALIKSYTGVNSCSIVEKLDGECTIEFTLMTRQIEGVVSIKDRVEVDGLVFYITEIRKNISGGVCYSKMAGEHISFLLNDDKYKVQAFEMSDTPRNILKVLLADTPFTLGDVDFDKKVTLLINKEVTRRACLMQLIALVHGEIEYDGYTIGIRKHIGSEKVNDIMKSSLVQDISYSHNVSDNTTSYSLSLYQKGKLHLGDELKLEFKPLGINSMSRIVGMDWNPFNYKEANITVGQYLPTINDSLYELVNEVSDIRESTAKYTLEFGEMIGNGIFYFTRSYRDRPYFQIQTNDGSTGQIELLKLDTYEFNPYVGAKLTGVNPTTSTLVVFYCTVPVDSDEMEEE